MDAKDAQPKIITPAAWRAGQSAKKAPPLDGESKPSAPPTTLDLTVDGDGSQPGSPAEAEPKRSVRASDEEDLSCQVDYEGSDEDMLSSEEEEKPSSDALTPASGGENPSGDIQSLRRQLLEDLGTDSSHGEEGEVVDTSTPVVTNATQHSEDAERFRSAPEAYRWMPPQWLVRRWALVEVEGRIHSIFDSSAINAEPPKGRSRFNYFVELFFLNRLVSSKWMLDSTSKLDAIAQAWDAFVSNVNAGGFAKWLARLTRLLEAYQDRRAFGAAMKLHKLSREHGLPCYVAVQYDCPHCVAETPRAWAQRIVERIDLLGRPLPPAMVAAIERLEELASAQGDARGHWERGGVSLGEKGETARTGQPAQGRLPAASRAAPTYPPRADTRASERGIDASYDHEPYDRDVSRVTQPPTSSRRGYSRAEEEAVGRVPREVRSAGAEAEWRRAILIEQTARSDVEARLRSDVSADRLRSLREMDAVTSELGRLRGQVSHLETELAVAQNEIRKLVQGHKSVLGILRDQGMMYQGTAKRPRTDGTGGGGPRKT
jgi:hypothetical protein